jgi:DedD protein
LNEKLKQRLVGAVVLVSLAIIFIPMMLDGGERSSMPIFGSNIPTKPDIQFEPLEIPLQPVAPIAEERPVLIDKPEPAPTKPAPAPTKPKPLSKQESAPTAKPAPAKPATDTAPDAWVVQVGSFSQSSNALALRDKLRAKGFTAFVEKLKSDSGTVYRVRIGPELKREKAEELRKRLKSKLRMKGIVMGHTS